MVKLVTKSFPCGKFKSFSRVEIKDEMLMYYIKKNYTDYTDLDLKEIKQTKKYLNFIKKYKTLNELKTATILDKNGEVLHGSNKKKSIKFLYTDKRYIIILGIVKLIKGGGSSSTSVQEQSLTRSPLVSINTQKQSSSVQKRSFSQIPAFFPQGKKNISKNTKMKTLIEYIKQDPTLVTKSISIVSAESVYND